MMYISTDSVFDGRLGGYSETDTTSPPNVYASAKLDGERRIASETDHYIVFRTSIYGPGGSGKVSLSDWILDVLGRGDEVHGFVDSIFSPLFTEHLTELVLLATRRRLSGLFHAGSRDSVSKYEFACQLARRFGLPTDHIVPTRLDSAGFIAPRPANTSLNSDRLQKALSIVLPNTQDGIGALYQATNRDRTVIDVKGS
jgi:dTDP-4-dehydrorhamnose reductase